MLRRSLRHMLRYPSMTCCSPGCRSCSCCCSSTCSAARSAPGSAARRGGRAVYVDYVAPGIILLAVAAAAQGTAISVAMDMTEGIVARFRTMAIARVLGADRPRPRQHDPDAARPGRRHRRRAAGGVPAHRRRGSNGSRRSACSADDQLRADLAVRRARPGRQERRDREQPPDAADAAAVPRQRLRPHRLDAGRPAAGSPSTSRSRRSSRRCAGCSWHPDRQQRACSPSPGAPGSRWLGYLWARKLFNRDPIR